MKKQLLSLSITILSLSPVIIKAQTYSAWGLAINQTNHMYDTLSASGDSLKFRFPNTHAIAWGTPKLVVYYEGNFGNYYDQLEVFSETLGNIGGTGQSSYGYPCAPEDSTVFNLTTADINTWTANNSIVFTFIPNSGPGFCTISRVRARLMYNYCLAGIPQFAVPSIPNAFVCSSDGPSTLTGTPTGGTFSGPGVTGSSFNPANLLPGTYPISYTATDSQSCTTTGSISVVVKYRPFVNNNATVYACNGSTVNLTTNSAGSNIWYTNAALTNSVANSNNYVTPALTQNTDYWVAAVDNNNSLSITTLSTSGAAVIDVNSLIGDDHGGMAITKRHVFLNGDNNAVRFDLNLTMASAQIVPIRDGMVSDLRTGKIWSLWNTITNTSPGNNNNFDANALRGLDSNLVFTNEYLSLSQTIDMGTDNEQNGIFAGIGIVGLYSGNTQHWYVIDMDNGAVNDLGYLYSPEFYGSETWSDWGVIESDCGGTYSVIYRDDNDNDMHHRVLPNGAVTTLNTFSGISDLASFVFNPWNNRWYFHYEGGSTQFGGTSETLGYADATATSSLCPGSGLSCPAKVTVHVPADVTFTLQSTVCLNNDALPLTSGSPAGGTYTGVGVGTNTSGVVFYPSLAGPGTYTLNYTYMDAASGCTDIAAKTVTVNVCTGIEEMNGLSGITVYPNPSTGMFNISSQTDLTSVLIEVTDIQGRVVYSAIENTIVSGTTKQVDLTTVGAGIYIVKLTSGTTQQIQRISVIR